MDSAGRRGEGAQGRGRRAKMSLGSASSLKKVAFGSILAIVDVTFILVQDVEADCAARIDVRVKERRSELAPAFGKAG